MWFMVKSQKMPWKLKWLHNFNGHYTTLSICVLFISCINNYFQDQIILRQPPYFTQFLLRVMITFTNTVLFSTT